MQIPGWIQNLYNMADSGCVEKKTYNYDKDKNDGVLDADEVKFAMENISIFKSGKWKIREGMTLEQMVEENRSELRKHVVYSDNEYKAGRKVSFLGFMFPAIFSRDKSVDNEKSIEVMQGEYAVKTYSKDTPAIQTCNVCNCVAVVIYDTKNKRGFVAHIDTTEKADSLKSVLESLHFNPEDCETHIIGGLDGRSEGNIEIIDTTLKDLGFSINEYDILGKSYTPRAIQLDLETGEVTDYEESNPLKNRPYQEVAGNIGENPLVKNKTSD